MGRSVAGVVTTSLFLLLAAGSAASGCGGSGGATECAAGFDACDPESDLCSTDLSTSAEHCGACGNACPANPNARPACRDRTCGNTCATGFHDCDGDVANGCETPTADDPNNCGGCGRRCPDGAECSGSVCRAVCTEPGRGDCNGSVEDGCETLLASSTPHCGACDQPCPTGLVCADSQCVPSASCRSLAGREPPLPNGRYRIDPDGPGPDPGYDAYCLLDAAAEGGGWSLALKVDGAKRTFEYGAEAWTSEATINAGSLALDFDEAKLPAFFRVPAHEARIGFRQGNLATRWIVIDGPAAIEGNNATLHDAFLAGTLHPTTEGRAAWAPLVDGAELQQSCNREGWNVKDGLVSVRIGIVSASGECDTGTAGSFLGIGSRREQAVAGFSRTESPVSDRPVTAYVLVR